MTMLDDDRLAALFDRAAAAFEVPASGAERILARAAGVTGDAPEPAGVRHGSLDADADDEGVDDVATARRGRRAVAVARRHPLVSVAACLVVALIVTGVIGAAVRAPSVPVRSAALTAPKVAPGGVRLPVTTTTLPASHAPGANSSGAPSNATSGSAGTPAGARSSTPNQPALPSGAVGQSTKIEQTGSLNLTVSRGDVARTMARLTALAATYQGFVASSQTQSGTGGSPYGTITLQVPVDDFSAALGQAERYGKASDVSTKATDVTGQYVDLQARLTALEASRQQYLAILAKATSIGDILSVQEQLDTIQSQIEQLQGQLQVLTSQTSYSTLTVTVGATTPPPRPNPLPESGLVQAWHSSVGGFVAGVEGVVRLGGPFLFALLCLAIAAVGGRLLWRRYQRHRL
jgi:hypothetical protein